MFSSFKTTIISRTNDDSFDKAFEKFDKSFEKMSEGFEEVSKCFSNIKSKGEIEKVTIIEIYGDTKQKALDEVNKLSVSGYKLDSIKEDTSKEVWIAKAVLKVK